MTSPSTQIKTTVPGGTNTDDLGEFVFLSGDRVVGRIKADCCVCAWKEGSVKWLGSEMASLTDTANIGQICILQLNRMRRSYKSYDHNGNSAR